MHYQIRVGGHLDRSWIESAQLTWEPEGTTLLIATLPDQAALYQVLLKLHSLGITLLSLERTASGEAVYKRQGETQ
jgi:hypothetical protein